MSKEEALKTLATYARSTRLTTNDLWYHCVSKACEVADALNIEDK